MYKVRTSLEVFNSASRCTLRHVRILKLVLPTIVLCAVSGCFDSKNPLSAPEESSVHTELLGTWIWNDSGVANDEWTISKAGDGFPSGMLRVDILQDGKKESMLCFSTRIGDDNYLNMANFKDKAVPEKWDAKLLKNYTLMHYRIRGDHFTGTLLNYEFITSCIRKGHISGKLSDDTSKEIFLTASSKELREFFAKHRQQMLDDDDTHSGTRKH